MAPLLGRQTPVDVDTDNPSATAAPPTDDSNVNSRADIYGSHNGLSNAQIGAIIGSVIGFTILVLIGIFCCMNGRRAARRQRRRERRYSREGSWTESEGSSSSGGSRSGRSVYGGDGPRKPPVARVRRNVTVVDREEWDGYRGGGRMREREREMIPGAPKWPTYRAIPIPNPRRNPNLRRQM